MALVRSNLSVLLATSFLLFFFPKAASLLGRLRTLVMSPSPAGLFLLSKRYPFSHNLAIKLMLMNHKGYQSRRRTCIPPCDQSLSSLCLPLYSFLPSYPHRVVGFSGSILYVQILFTLIIESIQNYLLQCPCLPRALQRKCLYSSQDSSSVGTSVP